MPCAQTQAIPEVQHWAGHRRIAGAGVLARRLYAQGLREILAADAWRLAAEAGDGQKLALPPRVKPLSKSSFCNGTSQCSATSAPAAPASDTRSVFDLGQQAPIGLGQLADDADDPVPPDSARLVR